MTYRLRTRFNPNQPRAPEGTSNGGQWVAVGGGDRPGTGGLEEQGQAAPATEAGSTIMNDLYDMDGPVVVREYKAPSDYDPERLVDRTQRAPQKAWDFHENNIGEHNKWRKADPEFAKAADNYQNTTLYSGVNAVLRGHTHEGDLSDPRIGHMAKHLQRLADAPELPEGTRLYRAFRNEHIAQNAESYVGKTLRDPGYLSTTANAHTFYNFYHGKGAGGRGYDDAVGLRITTKKGARGLLMGTFDHAPAGEFEVLMNRNTPFKVTGVTRVTDRTGRTSFLGGGVILDVEIG
jgi:hypothetical protein